jgi:hypothetical protein
LDEAGAEVVEGDCDLHGGVSGVGVAVAEKHDLVMVGEVVVGDGDRRRRLCDIDEAIGACRQRIVVDPHVVGCKHADGVAV